MRISDWSSDVCSSDLANVICPGFVRPPLVERQIPEQSKELGISEDEVIRKVMLKDTVDGELTTLADVAEVAVFQIGRASGRERVCQCVSISVVAVSLKKKHQNSKSKTWVEIQK